MLKKRLIFVLYFDSGHFYLSRNFTLQRVGDVRWLVEKFRFKTIGKFIDEIVVLDVSRKPDAARCTNDQFAAAVQGLMKQTFVPLTLGGGIRTVTDARRCFSLGADKILLNSPVLDNPNFVREAVSLFGAQAVIGAIDFSRMDGEAKTKIRNAQAPGLGFLEHLKLTTSLGVGELLINSIDQDGTGAGFDLKILEHCRDVNIPVILCGGAGKPEHFAEALSSAHVSAVATGHLFNFVGKGFENARRHLIDAKHPVRSV